MKKTILFIALALTSITNFSCSSDDNSSLNEIEQKLLGKWYFEEQPTDTPNNSFTFNSNKSVRYTYWTGGSNNDFDYEDGSWSMSGDILTMKFPDDDVELVFVQKVVFTSENIVKFITAQNSEYEAYVGSYYRY